MTGKFGHEVYVDGDVESTGQGKFLGIGAAPLLVASSLLVANLNSDYLDGNHGSYYLDAQNLTNKYNTLAGWGIEDAWTKAEADNRYLQSSWSPTLQDVLDAGNTADKSIILNNAAGSGLAAIAGNYGITVSATPEGSRILMTDDVDVWGMVYEGGTYATVIGQLRVGQDPVHSDDLARKSYVDAKTTLLAGAGANTWLGNNTGSAGVPTYNSLAALTKTDDANVTLTLGGTPATALAKSVSMTLGWAGQLAISRGGTGMATVGSNGQLLRSNGSALEYFTHDFISSSLIGAANGIAPLDGSGKVPSSYLPTTGMQYRGTWDASSNTPSLSDGTGTEGFFFRVTVAGTQNLGSGNITFSVGDDVIHNGTVWQRAPSGATATNLALGSNTSSTLAITNSNGTGFTLPAATTTLAGLLSAADKVKLNNALTSFTETDPVFTGSAAFGINAGNISNWNDAYSLRHAAVTLSGQNYLSLSGQAITANAVNLSGSHVTGTAPIARGGTGLSALGTAGQLLRVNSGASALEYWTPNYVTSTDTDGRYVAIGNYGADVAETTQPDASLVTGTNILLGITWTNAASTIGFLSTVRRGTGGYQTFINHTIDDGFYWRGRGGSVYRIWMQAASRTWVGNNTRSSTWVPTWTEVTGKPSTFAPAAHTLDSHSNVTITSVAADQVIAWSGSAWINKTLPAATTYTGSASITLSGSAFERAALTGDVTAALNSNNLTISNGAVTFAKMQSISDGRLLGRVTAGSGAIETLTAAQVRTLLNVADGANNYTHPNSGVSAGTYNNVTVNAQGHVTAGSNVAYLTAETDPVWTAFRPRVIFGDNATGTLNWAGDADTIAKSGFLYVYGTNRPGNENSHLIHAQHYALNHWMQIGSPYPVSGKLYYRKNNNGSIGSWRALADEDWVTAKNYLTGNQPITLSGDVSGSGATSITTTIAGGAVTYAKFQNLAGPGLIGRPAAGSGVSSLVTLGSGLSFSGNTLIATGSGGTVTSVALSAPTGFSVSGSPITASGTLALSFAAGYSLPTTAKQAQWDAAYAAVGTYVLKAGDTMTGGLTFSPDNTGIAFYGGAMVYKRSGGGLTLKRNNDLSPVQIENAAGTARYRIFSEDWSLIKGFTQFWGMGAGNDIATIGLDSGFYYAVNTTASDLPNNQNSYVIHVSHANNTQYALQLVTNYGVGSQKIHVRQNVNGTYGSYSILAYESWVTSNFAGINHTHATLTRGTGLTGSNYNGSAATTWAVAYGTAAGTAAQGNDSRINNGQTAYGWGDYRNRNVSTTGSLQGGGNLSTDRTLSLVGDNGAPGANTYYGTNGSGSKGWWGLPTTTVNNGTLTLSTGIGLGGSATFTANQAGNSTFNVTVTFGTTSGTVAAGDDGRFAQGVTAYSWGNHASYGYVQGGRRIDTSGSIQGGGDLWSNRTISLVGDNGAPGNNKYYGTNSGGTKGFWDLPTPGGGGNVTGSGSSGYLPIWNSSTGLTNSSIHENSSGFVTVSGKNLYVDYDMSANRIFALSGKIGGGSTESSAAFQINATSGGFLPPRMSSSNWNSISSKAEGLLYFDSTDKGLGWFTGSETIKIWASALGFWVYLGGVWRRINFDA